jgi:hypothetical protein
MAKTKNTEAQNPEEVQVQTVEQPVAEETTGGTEETQANAITIESADDGVAITSGGKTLLVVALTEQQTTFGGDESDDLEEDISSPGMTSMDGEQRSAFLSEFYEREEKAVPAIDACKDFGWLPSGGEMALIFAHKDAVNAKIAELGGTPIGDGKYWTSQRFSNDRMWHCDMNNGHFGIAIGTKSVAGVRAVRK